MSAPTPGTPIPLGRLDEPETIDDVLRNIDRVIEWAIKAESHIGYFAVLYKRTTLAIRDAIKADVFDDGPRMGALDVAFARRYFNALHAYLCPDTSDDPTLPWEVAFVGDPDGQAIILQHLMAGLNAHITFDLGLAVFAVAANSMDSLQDDYYRVNGVLDSQVPGVLKVIEQLSPELRWTRWLIPDQVRVFDRTLTNLRRGAWDFAFYLATHRQNTREKTVHQEAWTAALGSWYLQPDERWTPFPRIVRAIAKHESHDVAGNLRALEEVSNTPHPPGKAHR